MMVWKPIGENLMTALLKPKLVEKEEEKLKALK